MCATVFASEDDKATFHLDPWHKIAMGWVKPVIYPIRSLIPGSSASLRVPQGSVYKPIIFYDPVRGFNEFFIAEFRNRQANGGPYDTNLANNGIAIWYVQTDANHWVLDIAGLSGGNDRANFHLGASGQTRGGNRLWNSGNTSVIPRWLDGTENALEVKVDPFITTAGASDIEWNSRNLVFHPRIDKSLLTSRVVAQGGLISLDGNFGTGVDMQAVFLRETSAYDGAIESWND